MGAWGQVLILLAGPGAGFAFAALVLAGIMLSGHRIVVGYVLSFIPFALPAGIIGSIPFTLFLIDILYISIFWGILNLMPVYPLDGGQISRELFLKANPRDGIRQSLVLSVMTGIGLALVGALVMRDLLPTLLFAYLAYMSYTTLQAYTGRGGWRS
jgi:membrane-associated protease RseP (regulator of RpoE activity)